MEIRFYGPRSRGSASCQQVLPIRSALSAKSNLIPSDGSASDAQSPPIYDVEDVLDLTASWCCRPCWPPEVDTSEQRTRLLAGTLRTAPSAPVPFQRGGVPNRPQTLGQLLHLLVQVEGDGLLVTEGRLERGASEPSVPASPNCLEYDASLRPN